MTMNAGQVTRGLGMVLLVALTLGGWAAAEQDGRVASLPSLLTGVPGGQVEVPVIIDNAEGIIGYRMVVSFATPELSYVPESISTQDTLSEGFLTGPTNTVHEGIVSFSCAGPIALPAEEGVLVIFNLELAEDAVPGTKLPIELMCDEARFSRLNDGAIPLRSILGSIVVAQPEEE